MSCTFWNINSSVWAVWEGQDCKEKKEFTFEHGLRTPNEGINQKYLKNWADAADKICSGRT